MLGGVGTNCTQPDAGFTPAQVDLIAACTLTSASLSLLGAVVVVVLFACFPDTRSPTTSLVASLSTADGLTSLLYILTFHGFADGVCHDHVACRVGGALLFHFELSTFAFTAVLAWCTHLIVGNSKWREARRRMCTFVLVGWGSALPLTVGLWFAGMFGDSGTWCQIDQRYQWANLVFFYVPLFCAMALVATLNFLTVRGMRRKFEVVADVVDISKLVRRMVTVTALFVVVRLPGAVDRVYSALFPHSPSIVLAVLHGLVSPLQGFVNAFVYGAIVGKFRSVLAPTRLREEPASTASL